MTNPPTEPREPKVERWDGWLREMAPCDRFWKRLERDDPPKEQAKNAG